MLVFPDRRRFLRKALGNVAAGIALSRMGAGVAFAQSRDEIKRTVLRDGLAVFPNAGINAVAMSTPEGVLMVDGGLADQSDRLLSAVAAFAEGRPIHTLFNTHWHREQTGSNDVLGAAGTKIISHENTRLWLSTTITRPAERWTHAPLPERARPNQTFYTSGTMEVGHDRIEYRHLPQAHTDGDIYVFFPESNVLVASDLVSVGQYPILDYVTGGFLPGLVQANKTLLDLADSDTLVVPGKGPVQTRVHLQAQFDMLSAVLENMLNMLRKGFSAQDMVAHGVTKEFDEQWGNPSVFIESAYRGLWGHVREIRGIV